MIRVTVTVIFRIVFFRVFFHVVFFVLYFPYCIYGLNSELTLTIQNIDVTQETTEQLRYKRKKIETKFQQTIEEKQIGFDPECN